MQVTATVLVQRWITLLLFSSYIAGEITRFELTGENFNAYFSNVLQQSLLHMTKNGNSKLHPTT